ncbi:MAG: tRNA lysidine(34) synthetase TilS [Candidatus Moraniibacteriota bacterium]
MPLSKKVLPPREAPLSTFVRRCIKRAQNTAHKFDLWHRGDAFIVCVSGGSDSLCLLDMLVLLQKKQAFALHVVHVNYHLRGRDSTQDERLVRGAALRYGLTFSCLSQEKKLKNASEETLRDIRYAFFEATRQKINAHSIVVAHNQDDQAETLLMRLLRGAGLSGLSAMRPKNDHVIRPLIEMSRSDITQYLKERHITSREDKSNTDPRYFRNQIRHALIPYLEKNFQPQTRKLLAETALLLGEDYATLTSIPATLAIKQSPLAVEFSCAAIVALPLALIRQELRFVLTPFLSGKNPDKNLVNELIKALKSTKGKTQTLTFRGLKFVRKGDIVRLLNF